MSRLRIKIRVIGKKNQEFVRFILMPKTRRQRGKYLKTLGYWDTRQNRQTRFLVLNIQKIMHYYSLGATPNKKILHQIYNYLVDYKKQENWDYFKTDQLRLIAENEIKIKYL